MTWAPASDLPRRVGLSWERFYEVIEIAGAQCSLLLHTATTSVADALHIERILLHYESTPTFWKCGTIDATEELGDGQANTKSVRQRSAGLVPRPISPPKMRIFHFSRLRNKHRHDRTKVRGIQQFSP